MSEEDEEFEVIFEADSELIQELGNIKLELEEQKGVLAELVEQIIQLRSYLNKN